MGIKAYLVRWQEHFLWLPIVVGIAVASWIVLGALDRTAGTDMLSQLVELPIRSAYAVVALAIAFLVRRRQRHKMTDAQKEDYWHKVTTGWKGPLIVYITDSILWLATFLSLLAFFSR
jgi:hypothetical protein